MDVREKLAELIREISHDKKLYLYDLCDMFEGSEKIADLLIENGVTVQEWISVDDRLPEEKVNCIVHYKHAYCNNDGYWAIGFCFYDGEKFQFNQAYKVTHWMLIPNPPEEVNDGA